VTALVVFNVSRTSAGLAATTDEGRVCGRRKKLDDTKRLEIAEAVISGRKTAAQIVGVQTASFSAPQVAGVQPSVAMTALSRRQRRTFCWSPAGSPATSNRSQYRRSIQHYH
jgi:hypothetical protein